jgi:Transposase
VVRSRIEPMKKIARSLRQHRELILNYFGAQKLLSSGVVEGLNNKAKVTMRKSTQRSPTVRSKFRPAPTSEWISTRNGSKGTSQFDWEELEITVNAK